MSTPSGSKMERSAVLDSARALAMLYIVGYWHLFDYTQAFREYNNIYTESLTTAALAVFSFISGYLLSQKNEMLSLTDLSLFYKKRFLRIYPLYTVAILAFAYMTFYPSEIIYKPLLGLTFFSQPQIITLWFMTMLLFFYLITPLFLFCHHKQCLGLVFILVMESLVMYHQAYGTLDIRVMTYLPVFTGGIWVGKTRNIDAVLKHRPTIILSLILLVSGFNLINSGLQSYFVQVPFAIAGAVIFLIMAKYLTFAFPQKWFFMVSYASFSIYLFHRVFYHLLMRLYFPETLNAQVIYLYAVLLPLVCVLSFLIQSAYDRIFNFFTRKFTGGGSRRKSPVNR